MESFRQVDSTVLRRTCAKFPTGVALATVLDEQSLPHGMTVNSFTSVSLCPPLVLICVDLSCVLLDMFRLRKSFGVSVLRQDQQELSHRFAQRGMDRFDGIPWIPGSTGVPLIPGALAHLECELRREVEAGDHAVLIAEVLAAAVAPGSPLLFFDSGYRTLK